MCSSFYLFLVLYSIQKCLLSFLMLHLFCTSLLWARFILLGYFVRLELCLFPTFCSKHSLTWVVVWCPQIIFLEAAELGLFWQSLSIISYSEENIMTSCFTILWVGCSLFEATQSGLLVSNALVNISSLYSDCSFEFFLSMLNSLEYKENLFWTVSMSEFQALHKHCSGIFLLLTKYGFSDYISNHYYEI